MGRRAAFALLLCLFAATASAELVFSAPPREDPTEAQKLYAPLISELARVLGDKVVFEPPASWATYSQNMRDGKYDLVLDGPHFVAWRMAHIQHAPLVRFDGKMSFTLFVGKEGPKSLEDLRFKNVCVMASPNMAAVMLLSQFDAYTAPNLVAPRGGMKGSLEAFEAGGRCVAVMLPSRFVERLPAEKAAAMRKLFVSPEVPNLALTAGPRVPPAMQAALVKELTDAKVQERLKPVLENLGGKEGALVPAHAADFAGNEKYLEGVVWGW